MSSVLNSLKALVVGILTTEPVLVQAVLVAAITAVLALIGLSLPVTIVASVAAILIGAVVARLKVTPVQ